MTPAPPTAPPPRAGPGARDAVLHLLSNWKWTERAEPAALLARAQRDAGVRTMYVCHRAPEGAAGTAADRARALGLAVAERELPKHLRVRFFRRGARDVRAIAKAQRAGVLHCHMSNAHLTAAIALRGVDPPPLLVRSLYDPEGREFGYRERWIARGATDGTIVICEQARRRLIDGRGIPPERVAVIEPGIDLERFDPRLRDRTAARRRWNLPPETLVIGMVTRIRRKRRTDLGIGLLHALRDARPHVRLLLVGRGSPDEVRRAVTGPAARLGVAGRLIMAGYQEGDNLAHAYLAMDALLYPVAGTDQSCRTVREAMAAGVPVIAGKTGFAAHLIKDGVTGLLSDLSPGGLADMLAGPAGERAGLAGMGRAALAEAQNRFRLSVQAAKCMDFYQKLADMRAACAQRSRPVCAPSC